MAQLTLNNLDDELSAKLAALAAEHARSVEDEARDILRAGVGGGSGEVRSSKFSLISARFEAATPRDDVTPQQAVQEFHDQLEKHQPGLPPGMGLGTWCLQQFGHLYSEDDEPIDFTLQFGPAEPMTFD